MGYYVHFYVYIQILRSIGLRCAQHDIKDKKALMIALTIDGYYVKSKEKIYFISFDTPVFKALDYRKTLVKQAKDYRSFEL